jgi:hypothetical protein
MGPDGWKVGQRLWTEAHGDLGSRDGASLSHVISEWTELPQADAEALVEETVAEWRGSAAFEKEGRIGHQVPRVEAGLLVVVVLALVGIGALVWLIVSAVT